MDSTETINYLIQEAAREIVKNCDTGTKSIGTIEEELYNLPTYALMPVLHYYCNEHQVKNTEENINFKTNYQIDNAVCKNP